MVYSDIDSLLCVSNPVYIFGAGNVGTGIAYSFLTRIVNPNHIEGFFDNKIPVGTCIIDGLRIIDRNKIKDKRSTIIVVAVSKEKQSEIVSQLKDEGFKKYYCISSDDVYRICYQAIRDNDDRLLELATLTLRNSPIELQIETTSFCNAKCVFCPNRNLKRKKQLMSKEVFEKILIRAKEESLSIESFILHLNGEPLSDPNIFNRVRRIKEEFPKSNVRFTSNFELANITVVQRLLESGLDEITCSVNRLAETDYRNDMGLDFNKTIENVKLLLKMKEKTKNKIKVSLSFVADDSGKRSEIEESPIIKELEQYGNFDIRIMIQGDWGGEVDGGKTVSDRNGICPILYKTINILSNGSFALCCFDAEGIIGLNVMNTSIFDAWNSQIFNSIREHHLLNGKTNSMCINCSF